MRIAFVVGHFPRLSETFILNQVTGLIDRGHQVDIFSEYDGDWNHVHPDVERYNLQQHTYPLYRAPKNYFWRVLKGMGLLLSRFPKAPKLFLRSLNVFQYGSCVGGFWLPYSAATLLDCGCPAYDVVHAQFGTQGYQAWFLQQIMLSPRPKLVVMFRGHDISSFVQKVGHGFYDKLFSAADACLTNCEFFRQRVIQLGCSPNKIAVHYSGLNIEKFIYRPRRILPGEPIRLITTGRLVEKKGIEYAIRAISYVAPQYPQLQYTIVGDGPLRSTFEGLVEELALTDKVQLVGWQSEEALIHYLNQAHIFIAPSVTAANGNQDAPVNVLKEAMAIGLPVISTEHGGIPELVQDGVSGYLVPERDPQALAERLRWLLDDPDHWPEMGLAGRMAVENAFNLTALNDLLVARYQALLRSDSLTTSPNAPRSLPELSTPTR